MYPCKANREGEYCEMPAEKGGYCRYHQKILPKNKKLYPCMKSHKSKKFNIPGTNKNNTHENNKTIRLQDNTND
jgi:hypothetical protein